MIIQLCEGKARWNLNDGKLRHCEKVSLVVERTPHAIKQISLARGHRVNCGNRHLAKLLRSFQRPKHVNLRSIEEVPMPIRIIRYHTCPNNYVLATPEISIDVYESRYDNRATYHRNRQQQDYS